MCIAGPVNLQNVTALLHEGTGFVRDGAEIVDLREVTGLDSSLLAALLAWMREARAANHPLTVENMPSGLKTLAQLYGVEELLPATPRP